MSSRGDTKDRITVVLAHWQNQSYHIQVKYEGPIVDRYKAEFKQAWDEMIKRSQKSAGATSTNIQGKSGSV
ncbi:MAG TPA: hypothetical protein VLG38_07510, partial [Gammaproteobacteria bacterium]|nr:hypothetical protein [Gammaproteobacteria bacterium]